MARRIEVMGLALWGLLVSVGIPYLYLPRGRHGLGGRLRWLTISFAVLVGVGLLATAHLYRRGNEEKGDRVPALSVLLASSVGGVSSVFALEPWGNPGLLGPFTTLALVVLLLGFSVLWVLSYSLQVAGRAISSLVLIAGLSIGAVVYPLDDANMLVEYPTGAYPLLFGSLVGVSLFTLFILRNAGKR